MAPAGKLPLLRSRTAPFIAALLLGAAPALAETGQQRFTAEDAAALGFASADALVRLTPNLVIAPSPYGAAWDRPMLRGLALPTLYGAIPLPGLSAADVALFNPPSVAVGRGPTRFAPSGGGAILIAPPDLPETVAGHVEAGIGGTGDRLLSAAIALPLDPKLTLAVSGYWTDGNGRARNSLTGQRINDPDRAGLRFAARLAATDQLAISATLLHSQSGDERLPTFGCDPADPTRCDGRFTTTGLRSGAITGGGPRYGVAVSGANARQPLGSETETTLASAALSADFGAHRLALEGGWISANRRSGLDTADGRALPDLANPDPIVRGFADGGRTVLEQRSIGQFHQQAMLEGPVAGSITYRTGLSITDSTSRIARADILTPENGTATGVPQLLSDRHVRLTRQTLLGFAEVEARHGPLLLLARLAHGRKQLRQDQQRQSQQLVQPMVRLGYALSPDISLSVTASRALLPADEGLLNLSDSWPEAEATLSGRADRYEAAMAGRWFEGRLAMELTAFLLRATTLAPLRNEGAELTIRANPLGDLALFLSAGHQSARWQPASDSAVQAQQRACAAELADGRLALAPGAMNAPSCASGLVTADARIATPAYAPRWSVSAGASHSFAIPAAGILLAPAVTAHWRSAMETAPSNASLFTAAGGTFPANSQAGQFLGGSRSPARWLVSAAITLSTDDDNWRVTAGCDNCLDSSTPEAAIGLRNILATQRQWMVRARRSF